MPLPATPVPPTATPQAGPPAAPSNLTMTRTGSKDFLGYYTYEMSWRDNSNNELGFRIYNFDLFLTVAANTTGAAFDSFDLPSFTPDPCFSVSAYNAQGESPAAVFCFTD